MSTPDILREAFERDRAVAVAKSKSKNKGKGPAVRWVRRFERFLFCCAWGVLRVILFVSTVNGFVKCFVLFSLLFLGVFFCLALPKSLCFSP